MQDYVYWTDWETESIQKVNKFTGEGRETVAMHLFSAMDLHVYHKLKQPEVAERPCANSVCSHICLPNHRRTPGSADYTCYCPDETPTPEGGHIEYNLLANGTCQQHVHHAHPGVSRPTPPSSSDEGGKSESSSEESNRVVSPGGGKDGGDGSASGGASQSGSGYQETGKIALIVIGILVAMVLVGIVVSVVGV